MVAPPVPRVPDAVDRPPGVQHRHVDAGGRGGVDDGRAERLADDRRPGPDGDVPASRGRGRAGRRRRRPRGAAAPAAHHPGVHARRGRRPRGALRGGRGHAGAPPDADLRAGPGSGVQLPGLAGDPAGAGPRARAQAGGHPRRRQHQSRARHRTGHRRTAHRRCGAVAGVRAQRRLVRLRVRRALALEAPRRGGRRTAGALRRGGPGRHPLRHVLAPPARRPGALVRVRRGQRRLHVAAARVRERGARLGLGRPRYPVRRHGRRGRGHGGGHPLGARASQRRPRLRRRQRPGGGGVGARWRSCGRPRWPSPRPSWSASAGCSACRRSMSPPRKCCRAGCAPAGSRST